jgi:NRAMP (natural resistance-associated macrophage protein)-like metal ion transporter
VWVVVLSNLIAIQLQTLAARLGLVTGRNLAQVCRESYPRSVCVLLWLLSEVSIVALDATMVVGTAVGLNLLFKLPLLPAILATSLDGLLLLLLVPRRAVRSSEALTVGLLAVVVLCFIIDLAVSRPQLAQVRAHGGRACAWRPRARVATAAAEAAPDP